MVDIHRLSSGEGSAPSIRVGPSTFGQRPNAWPGHPVDKGQGTMVDVDRELLDRGLWPCWCGHSASEHRRQGAASWDCGAEDCHCSEFFAQPPLDVRWS